MDIAIQQKILDESWGYQISPRTGPTISSIESMKLLDYWNSTGVLDKINKLYDGNKDLDFIRLKRTNTRIIIPFKSDPSVSIQISPEKDI